MFSRLLNYNQHLYDLIEYRWKLAAIDDIPNPLGLHRDKADFHALPIHAKAKLLQIMCDWRLEMPDVETLTKVPLYYLLFNYSVFCRI